MNNEATEQCEHRRLDTTARRVASHDARRPMCQFWEWQRFGQCRGLDPDVFFSADHERGAPLRAREEAAKRICRDCSVREDCLAYAVSHHEPYGIWGGTTPREREGLIAAAARLGVTCEVVIPTQEGRRFVHGR